MTTTMPALEGADFSPLFLAWRQLSEDLGETAPESLIRRVQVVAHGIVHARNEDPTHPSLRRPGAADLLGLDTANPRAALRALDLAERHRAASHHVLGDAARQELV